MKDFDQTEVAEQLPMYERHCAKYYWLCEVKTILVAMRLGETPVHIPNTMVKTQTADDTILETVWESRWLPDQKLKYNYFNWAYSSAG